MKTFDDRYACIQTRRMQLVPADAATSTSTLAAKIPPILATLPSATDRNLLSMLQSLIVKFSVI